MSWRSGPTSGPLGLVARESELLSVELALRPGAWQYHDQDSYSYVAHNTNGLARSLHNAVILRLSTEHRDHRLRGGPALDDVRPVHYINAVRGFSRSFASEKYWSKIVFMKCVVLGTCTAEEHAGAISNSEQYSAASSNRTRTAQPSYGTPPCPRTGCQCGRLTIDLSVSGGEGHFLHHAILHVVVDGNEPPQLVRKRLPAGFMQPFGHRPHQHKWPTQLHARNQLQHADNVVAHPLRERVRPVDSVLPALQNQDANGVSPMILATRRSAPPAALLCPWPRSTRRSLPRRNTCSAGTRTSTSFSPAASQAR